MKAAAPGKKATEPHARQKEASETLQRFARCVAARWVLRQRRARRTIALGLQSARRGYKGRKRFRKLKHKHDRNVAASQLQRMYRGGMQRRRFLWALRARRRETGAMHIQRLYRGRLGRTRAKKRRIARDKKDQQKVDMACRIQRRWRRREAELAYANRVAAAVRLEVKRQECAVLLQSALRRRRDWSRVHKLLARRRAKRLENAMNVVEKFDEKKKKLFYYNKLTGTVSWSEPPDTGYTKQDGKIVLETGKVLDENGEELLAEAEEEGKENEQVVERPMCVEYPDEFATKWDVVWDEPFCDKGWAEASKGTCRAAAQARKKGRQSS